MLCERAYVVDVNGNGCRLHSLIFKHILKTWHWSGSGVSNILTAAIKVTKFDKSFPYFTCVSFTGAT